MKILSYFISLLTPLALIGLALRILLTPIFYTIEYNMPYFPIDQYGFTKEDRLKYAPYAVNYLIQDKDISYLRDLTFDDGSPLYNPRELRHMQDVKQVITGALITWYITLVALFASFIIAYKRNWVHEYMNGLRRGGWWMIGVGLLLVLVAGAGILLNPNIFWAFFSNFHAVFFEGDSWLFYYSDTLIRLFPIRFWQDAVIAIGIISLSGAMGLILGLKKYAK